MGPVPVLLRPNPGVAFSVRDAARGGTDDLPEYGGAVVDLPDEELPGYVAGLLAQADDATSRGAGSVPATHLWWVDGTLFLGRVHLRHRLTPSLREVGGHVGYHVVPAHRRRGHATAMLAATRPVAAGLGIDSLLVTCDADNTASRKVIEANGGRFEDRRGIKLRYWVPTTGW